MSYFSVGNKKVLYASQKKYNNLSFYVYPSTVFIDEKPKEFIEYFRAKEEGEFFCRKFNQDFPSIKIICPRLPRMATDQNQALTKIKVNNPIPLMISLLRGKSHF
tara:strand:- start:222 stop:536 length:315 start_codon:yes stop_codon:yes gene_type:complete